MTTPADNVDAGVGSI